jgi:hypothetical protein
MSTTTIVDVPDLAQLTRVDLVIIRPVTSDEQHAWLVADPRRLRLARRAAYLDVRLRQIYRAIVVQGPAPERVLDEFDAALTRLEEAVLVAAWTLDAPHVQARRRLTAS